MFKTTWKSYFKNNEKIPGNLLKNLEKSWKYHGILSVRKSGNPGLRYDTHRYEVSRDSRVTKGCQFSNITTVS